MSGRTSSLFVSNGGDQVSGHRQLTRTLQLVVKRVSFEIRRHQIPTALGAFVDLNELQDARMIKQTANLSLPQVLDAPQVARRHFHHHVSSRRYVDCFEN